MMIKTVRMMRGAGAWQVLDGTVTGGAPQAQVGTALTTILIHLSKINVSFIKDKCICGMLPCLLNGLFLNEVHFSVTACKLLFVFHCSAQKRPIFNIQATSVIGFSQALVDNGNLIYVAHFILKRQFKMLYVVKKTSTIKHLKSI